MEPSRFGLSGWLIALGLAGHTFAAAVYGWMQPRGFTVLSSAFVERQVIVPAVLAISLVALLGLRRRPTVATVLGTAVLAGFWTGVAVVTLVVGTTVYALAMTIPLGGAVAALALSGRRTREMPLAWILHAGGTACGLALAAGFLVTTWAPPATTHPRGGTVDGFDGPSDATPLKHGAVEVAALGQAVEIRRDEDRILVYPAMEFSSASRSGHWTVFDFRRLSPGAWRVIAREERRMLLETPPGPITARALVSVDGARVRIVSATTLHEEVAAHLSAAVRVVAPGEARLEGHPWRSGHEGPRSEFMAFREGSLEFLRAAHYEKGPFETVTSFRPRDPQLDAGVWSIHVNGWLSQASKAESPTAGWGVSQGTIERAGEAYRWSLAQTSIGRGWQSVRIAPGTYLFEIEVTTARK